VAEPGIYPVIVMKKEAKPSNSPLLEMRQIDKSFPGVQALKNVSLKLHCGEVLGLVGENGAGKSTLIKVLGGAHLPDAGKILIEGRPVHIPSPTAAQQAGVSIIYQEFNLIPELTVRENIFLGREKTRMGFVRAAEEHRKTLQLFRKIGINIVPNARCSELTVAQQQTVEIAKALSVNAKIIVMDEPTATLTTQEVQHLFAIVRDLKSHGLGIIYISHRLDEIFEVADRAMVLRDGEHVGTRDVNDITREKLIEMMVGRPIESEFPKRAAGPGRERLRVEDLCRGKAVRNVSFIVRAGEVLGFAGLVGAGRTETMRLIFGADKADKGRIFIDGRKTDIRSPGDAIRNRICLLTEDRKGQGLVLIHSCRENFGLPNLDRFVHGMFLDQRRERKEFSDFVESLRIKVSGHEQLAMNLSGGNQQKVVLAKWLARNADIMIFDEPTRGIDVGTKYEIYLLMNRLAAEGKAIIMISSELPEILGFSDRIIVMHEGRIKGEITEVANTTQEDILSMAIA
jgi:ribose transport system ATP-binding protein